MNKQPDKRITALYARLSRDDEKESVSGSIQNQRAILEKYAKDNKLPNPRFFYDDEFSGVSFTRPAFMEIMELAERGLVENLVVKDHSRLGRNRLVVGQLLEEDFVRLDVRYIAIMDNIDTAKGISDIAPMQDLFNEWHAKNTSDKVRRVMQSKGMSGKPLTTNPPFGYEKAPDDKDSWVIDEPAAEVVRKIFDLCISGLGPTQIAKQMKSEKVMTPTEYWNSIGRKCGKLPEIPFNWCPATVSDILDKQEYCGDTVNFRTTSKSFKLKKYNDIINLPHKQSRKRKHMPVSDRAAQFAPFAALTGYGEEVAETARLTDKKTELSEEQIGELNTRINFLKSQLYERPEICITFFAADDKKDGGSYQKLNGIVKKIDYYARIVELESGYKIAIDDIRSIADTDDGRFFSGLERDVIN